MEACAILANKMTNYLSSVTKYITILTNEQFFDYPTLVHQITRVKSRIGKIPHLIPFLERNTKAKNKIVMRAAELKLKKVEEDHELLRSLGSGLVQEEVGYDEIA
jgi:hypothetical protein